MPTLIPTWRRLVLALPLIMLCAARAGQCAAQEPGQAEPGAESPSAPLARERRNLYVVYFGADYWSGIGDLHVVSPGGTAAPGAPFETVGFSFEASLYRRVGRLGADRSAWGGDLGLLDHYSTGSDILFDPGTGARFRHRLDSSVVYLTGGYRRLFPARRRVDSFMSAGAGFYALSIDDNYQVSFTSSFESIPTTASRLRRTTAGAYLGAGIDVHLRNRLVNLRFEDKVQYFSFGGLGDISPDRERIGGLVDVVQIGVVFK